MFLKLGGQSDVAQHGVAELLSFGLWNVPDRLQQAPIVKPIDPFQRGVFDGFERAPRSSTMDHLGFVETVDCFGQSVVVAFADVADGWRDTDYSKALGALDGHVLRSKVALMNQASAMNGSSIVDCLLQCIQHEAGLR